MVLLAVIFLFNADFPICTAPDYQFYPCTVYADSMYYVFWEDRRFVNTDSTYSIFASRVTIGGTVLDPDGKLIFRDTAYYEPVVAFDGTNFLVVHVNNM